MERVAFDSAPSCVITQMLTKVDVAKQARVCRRTVDYWIKTKRLPFIKLGKAVRFLPANLEKFILSQRIGGN
jgi:excisionase family DNA binding protein